MLRRVLRRVLRPPLTPPTQEGKEILRRGKNNIRTAFLMENNIREMRFKNEVVYQNIEVIIDEIKRYKTEYEQINSSPESGEARRGLKEGEERKV